MTAKIITPKKPRGIRKEMECNAYRNYTGPKGCGVDFTFVPSDTRQITIEGNYRNEGPRFKVAPVERYVTCPACRGACFVETVRPGVEYTKRELDAREAFVDTYGRGQGGH